MPTNRNERVITMTPVELREAMQEYTPEQRREAMQDVLVPTPQQQHAARKRELIRRARELGIYGFDQHDRYSEIQDAVRNRETR